MQFADFVQVVDQLQTAAPDQAVALLAALFRRAEFGEAGMLLALLQDKPLAMTQPWLPSLISEGILLPVTVPKPHTLARIFLEMQRIGQAGAEAGASRKYALLNSVEGRSGNLIKRLLKVKREDIVEPAQLEAALRVVEGQAGIPLLPEKLIRYTSEEIEAVWDTLGASYAHVKDDGYYCQLHKDGAKVLLYTGANLMEQGQQYPELSRAAAASVKGEKVVLEGELVGLSAEGKILPRTRMSRAAAYQLRLYDLLYVEGEDWRQKPYELRRQARLKLVQTGPELGQAEEYWLDSKDALKALSLRSKAEGWEGLVIKPPTVVYRSGQSNPRCIKLKEVEPVDATVVGYFTNETGGIKTFLLALYNEETGRFESCGQTGAGLSPKTRAALAAWLTAEASQDLAVRVVAKKPPDVWLKPKYIFEFLVDYRYPSEQYSYGRRQTGQGWALHNPVFCSIEPRLDKSGHQTTTTLQFMRLRVEARQSSLPEQAETTNNEPTGQQLTLFGS